jgi:hypothetical protein
MLTCIVVGSGVVTYCWIGPLSLLVIDWTSVRNWFPIVRGVYIGGTTSSSCVGYTYPCT